jgi:glycosyltransferase involved in cell wall biosynthesis
MTPRVSVVVPAYNSVSFIGDTMDSILAQTFGDFELLVCDHSSTDGTWEALQQYSSDPRVRLSRLPAGGGAPANWNAVTEQAGAELIKLVCSDDLVYPSCLAEQVAALDAHPGSVLAASTRDIVDAGGRPVVRGRGLAGLRGVVEGRHAIRATVRAGTNIFGEPASVLIRRDVLAAEGNWDPRSPYLIDEASYVRVLLHGHLVALKRPLAGFRVSDQQWSVALMRSQAAQAKEFHRRLAAEHAGLLSQSDVRLGNGMAEVNALLRRGVYLWLGRRMRAQKSIRE